MKAEVDIHVHVNISVKVTITKTVTRLLDILHQVLTYWVGGGDDEDG